MTGDSTALLDHEQHHVVVAVEPDLADLLHVSGLLAFFPHFFFRSCADHRDLHSFPTRRSSDLRNEGPPWHERLWVRRALATRPQPDLDAKIGRAHAELQSRENLVCRRLLEK